MKPERFEGPVEKGFWWINPSKAILWVHWKTWLPNDGRIQFAGMARMLFTPTIIHPIFRDDASGIFHLGELLLFSRWGSTQQPQTALRSWIHLESWKNGPSLHNCNSHVLNVQEPSIEFKIKCLESRPAYILSMGTLGMGHDLCVPLQIPSHCKQA